MNVRKLLWLVSGYTAALLLSHYLLPRDVLLPAAASALLLGLLAILLRRRRFGTQAMLALLAAAMGFGWSWGYARLFVDRAELFVGQERSVTVLVTDWAEHYDDYSRIRVRCVDETLPHVRMLIYDYNDSLGEACPGDLAEMDLKLLSAGTRYGEDSDYYLASGIGLRGYIKGDCTVLGRHPLAWLYAPKELSRLLQDQTLRCFPEDVRGLMKALLTGSRTEYYLDEELSSAMRGAGLSHVVAVSGMHVAFLVGFLRLLTGRRRASAFVGIPLVLVFMAMIGFTPSVTRAGIAQILLLLAPLFRRENDPPSALALSLGILLLFNPLAVGSLSLQFSFAAMAGLILISPPLYRRICTNERGRSRLPRGFWGKLLSALAASFCSGLGATVFTAPLSAIHFGYLPLYGILSNLLCLWLVSGAFLLGYLVCILGLISAPLGAAAGWALGWLPRVIRWIVEWVYRLPHAILYTKGNLAAWWLVFVYLVFLSAWLLREKGKPLRPVIPLCLTVCGFCLLLLTEPIPQEGLRVSALDVGQGQCIAACTGNYTVLIDCGGNGSSNAGETAAAFLARQGRFRVDLLVLTHLDSDHVNGVRRLLAMTRVSRLALAADVLEDPAALPILSACRRFETEVFPISEDYSFTSDGLCVQIFAPIGTGDANNAGLMVYGDWGDWEFLVTGDADSSVERALTVFYDLGDIELLVAGHHGSRHSTSAQLLDSVRAETVLISCGANNRYGHPAPELLERLAQRNITVHRTDLEGTVTVYAN